MKRKEVICGDVVLIYHEDANKIVTMMGSYKGNNIGYESIIHNNSDGKSDINIFYDNSNIIEFSNDDIVATIAHTSPSDECLSNITEYGASIIRFKDLINAYYESKNIDKFIDAIKYMGESWHTDDIYESREYWLDMLSNKRDEVIKNFNDSISRQRIIYLATLLKKSL